eukprot:TRINITY_DN7966_c0_g1_i3.p4 TRINITY_DN7966_c0_g1~~TRINITY_DN7966_c0_g1_i3.p4  ORF type:complete len:131 (+),score=34.00 TRINITY_DN7966_c0_g1_i3:335-727(+)
MYHVLGVLCWVYSLALCALCCALCCGISAWLQLAQSYPGTVFATAGVHPYSVLECNQHTLQQLEQMSSEPQVVAIGECGLDSTEGFPPVEAQLPWFEAQVELGCRLGLPLFLHHRGAQQLFLQVLDRLQG